MFLRVADEGSVSQVFSTVQVGPALGLCARAERCLNVRRRTDRVFVVCFTVAGFFYEILEIYGELRHLDNQLIPEIYRRLSAIRTSAANDHLGFWGELSCLRYVLVLRWL